jgi:lipoprotein signal peptidase
MKRQTLVKYGIFFFLLIAGVVADQWTKHIASENLAAQYPGVYDHSIYRTVPDRYKGETLETYLNDELEWNRPEEVERIARRWTLDAETSRRLGPKSELEAGQRIKILHREITVVEGYFDFEYARNRGAAFSFLADADEDFRIPFFMVVGVLAIVVILWILHGVHPSQKLMIWGLGLIAGGAIGNFIDRIRFEYVVDFILWKYTDEYRWPVFNIADTLIVVGVALMIIVIIRDGIREARAERSELEVVEPAAEEG